MANASEVVRFFLRALIIWASDNHCSFKLLSVTDKDDLEKLEVMTDRFPLLKLRKSIYRSFILLNMVCKTIIETKVFDHFTTMVILANCGTMMANQPLD